MYCKTITPNTIEQNIGNYIQLGGFGIIDGLVGYPRKSALYRIIGLNAAGDMLLRGYRQRRNSRLPSYNFLQEAIIMSPKEYKKFPIY